MVGRFEWERTVRALALPSTTKLVALMLASYTDGASGGNAHPGEDRLAADCSLSDRAVRSHLQRLRETGLLVRSYRGRANQHARSADVYELDLPSDVTAKVGLTPRHPALGGSRYRNEASGSGVSATGTGEHLLPEPDDALPEPDDRATGTHVPPINHGTKDGYQPGPISAHLPTQLQTARARARCPECEHERFTADNECLRCGAVAS